MQTKHILPRTIEVFKNMAPFSKIYKAKPCYALIHLPDGSTKVFNHSTARQMNKYMYANVGALKNGLRSFLESNVYDLGTSRWGYEERNYMSQHQTDELIKYLFENNIVEIVYVYDDEGNINTQNK